MCPKRPQAGHQITFKITDKSNFMDTSECFQISVYSFIHLFTEETFIESLPCLTSHAAKIQMSGRYFISRASKEDRQKITIIQYNRSKTKKYTDKFPSSLQIFPIAQPLLDYLTNSLIIFITPFL